MLKITIPKVEYDEIWDEKNEKFIPIPKQCETTLQLEHSLISISKWESKWCKAFFSKKEKTYEETIDYIRCMTLTPNVKSDVYYRIGKNEFNIIREYMEAPMTATVVNDSCSKKRNSEIVTSELIYYWMVALNIPFECQKWHINRLLMLIRVCNAKNEPAKKMSRKDVMSRNAAINAANRKKYRSKG